MSIIAIAEKLHELVENAPAGGLFHDSELSDVAGVEIAGFGGAAGFSITGKDGLAYTVRVEPGEPS